MNLLVTGAAGFIGSHYVLRHREKHPRDSIVVLDLLTYAADIDLLGPVKGDISFVQGDIADEALVEKIVTEHSIDTIVNFAAESHVDRSIDDPAPFLHTNVLGVQSLIHVLRRHPSILLLHISTDEVYGDLNDGDSPFTLESPLRPSSPYSASKAAGDLLLLASARTYGVRVRLTRCTNNYGPHQDRTKLLPVVITHAFQNRQIPIYAEGKQKRDWLYVTDHTDAIELVLEKGKDGQTYLIGADDERENIAMVKTVLAILQKPETLIEFVKDRPGHDWRYALDSSSVRALGWKQRVPFDEGIRMTIEWWRERASVLRPIS